MKQRLSIRLGLFAACLLALPSQGCLCRRLHLLPGLFHCPPLESVPSAPPEAEVREYAVSEFPFAPSGYRVDVKKHLKTAGIRFPDGGFAYYFPKAHSLVVATTPAQQEKLASRIHLLAESARF